MTREEAIKTGKVRRDAIEKYKEKVHLRRGSDIRNLTSSYNYKGEDLYDAFTKSTKPSKKSS